MALRRVGERFTRLMMAILMAVVMTLAPLGSASAMTACGSSGGQTAVSEAGHSLHRHMAAAGAEHAAMTHEKAAHHPDRHQPSCCASGCLACTPAILSDDPGVPLVSVTAAFVPATDTHALGRSPSPPLGPPRSRI